jgi:uncharacterized protein involved in type VI secretion and phage assembly
MGLENMVSDYQGGAERRVSGVVIGIVTNNRDPDGLGRVKVNFPWRDETTESDWARLATLYAGNGRGSVFYPEVNDEVLVAFEQGDINRPFVIGGLWNGRDTSPEPNSDGKNNIKKFRSRSGHEIIFCDDSDAKKEKIEIHTNAGHKVVLDDAAGGEKIEITDKTGSNKVVIDSVKNSISVESSLQLNLKSTAVEIEGTGSLTLKSSGILTIQGSMVKIN